MNSTAAEPLKVEVIGKNTVSIRPLQNGGFLISCEGELKAGYVKLKIEEAFQEFYYTCQKVTSYVFGANHYWNE